MNQVFQVILILEEDRANYFYFDSFVFGKFIACVKCRFFENWNSSGCSRLFGLFYVVSELLGKKRSKKFLIVVPGCSSGFEHSSRKLRSHPLQYRKSLKKNKTFLSRSFWIIELLKVVLMYFVSVTLIILVSECKTP